MQFAYKLNSSQEQLIHPSIPGRFLLDVIQAAQYKHIPITPILQKHGCSQTLLEQCGIRVSVKKYSSILKEMGVLTQDAFYGFLSKPIPLNALNVFCVGILGCRNLEELIKYANSFYGLLSDEFYWVLTVQEKTVCISINITQSLPVDYRFIIQSLLLMTIRLFSWLLGEDVDVEKIYFPFTKSESDDRLSYLFGENIVFGASEASILLKRSYLSMPLSANRQQVESLVKNKRNLFLLSRKRNLYSQNIRRMLLAHRDIEWLGIEVVASLLKSTPNAIWRKLKSEGTSFIDIRDQLKRDFALTLLENRDFTVEQIADQLHYNDTSAFRKAFKKWTGMNPVKYRELTTIGKA